MEAVDMSSCCIPCDRSFDSMTRLKQHLRDSPVHARSFKCDDCDRTFNSKEALQQHLRSSPAHNFKCNDCDQTFNSREALQQHLQDASIHQQDTGTPLDVFFRSFPTFDYDPSLPPATSFANLRVHKGWRRGGPVSDNAWNRYRDALRQHLQNSPAQTFKCNDCDRTFDSREALQQHLQDASIHQQDTGTPLDVFFRSFPTFDYDPSLPPATSYANLQRHEGLYSGNPRSDDAWERYQDALQSELHLWYGAENDLTAWHALCRAIGVEPLPTTCRQCEEAARRTHVNIIDLIQYGRSGSEKKVQTFRDVEDLRTYTKETRKICSNTFDQESGNVVLQHLLRKIF